MGCGSRHNFYPDRSVGADPRPPSSSRGSGFVQGLREISIRRHARLLLEPRRRCYTTSGDTIQSPGDSPSNCIPELARCVEKLGFIGCNLNPDPSGGHWTDPPMTDPWWFDLYAKLEELDVPAMIHVSQSCNPNFHFTGAHYINADTAVFMQLLKSDLFVRFPRLKLIIPHGGGAVPYHWGRYRGIAIDMKRPEPAQLMAGNLFFDTCVYHQPGVDLLADVVAVDNILFASEMHGAVRCKNPDTGRFFDDTRQYIEANTSLSAEDREKIYWKNALKVFTRLKLSAVAD
ncbi:MAG: amidohydrolase [Rhodospirillales bacterium]|nr:amidohydrolase [Rhodospirillales bacterium]